MEFTVYTLRQYVWGLPEIRWQFMSYDPNVLHNRKFVDERLWLGTTRLGTTR